MTPQERIKADAEKFSYMGIIGGKPLRNEDKFYGYIAGATAENSRAQKLADDIQMMLDQIEYSPELSWFEIVHKMKGIGLDTLRQWKGKEVKDE